MLNLILFFIPRFVEKKIAVKVLDKKSESLNFQSLGFLKDITTEEYDGVAYYRSFYFLGVDFFPKIGLSKELMLERV